MANILNTALTGKLNGIRKTLVRQKFRHGKATFFDTRQTGHIVKLPELCRSCHNEGLPAAVVMCFLKGHAGTAQQKCHNHSPSCCPVCAALSWVLFNAPLPYLHRAASEGGRGCICQNFSIRLTRKKHACTCLGILHIHTHNTTVSTEQV